MKVFFILALLAGPAAGPPSDYRLVNPRAIELFEQDERLMRWAVDFFDLDRDGRLSIREADLAARQFKHIADGDRDGRVTPAEYRAAVAFIVARWAGR
ncbi:MAG TPA: hypothetical protein VMK31_06905 [Sphingomicrobium sp.]|nr:hypothetical protein [Sphingomicrobium sp.]